MSLSPYQQSVILERLEELKYERSLSLQQTAEVFGCGRQSISKNRETLGGVRHSPRVMIFFPDLLIEAVKNKADQLGSPTEISRKDPNIAAPVKAGERVTITQSEIDAIVETAVNSAVDRMCHLLEANGWGEIKREGL